MAPALLLLGFFALVGAAFVVRAAVIAWRGLRTRSWPSVEGTVIRSWILQRGSNVGRDNSDRRGRAAYFAEVEYGYVIDGKAMRGDRISMGVVPSRTRAAVEAEVANWPEDAKVRVFYDPSDPASSVLVTGPNRQAVLRSAMPAAFFLGISIFLFVKLSDSGLLDQ